MSLPPAFPKSFYAKLASFATEFRVSRVSFVMRAIDHYAAELRKRKSLAEKALGSADLADQYSELSSTVSKLWWAKQSPKARAERARKAAMARWAKTKQEKGET